MKIAFGIIWGKCLGLCDLSKKKSPMAISFNEP